MKRRPTIHDVARASGFSIASVSNALNEGSKVAPGTRQHILKVAEQLGYRPNQLRAAFALARTHKQRTDDNLITVAVLTRERGARLHRPDSRTAADAGFTLEFVDTLQHPDPRKLSRQLYHRGVKALVLNRILQEDDYFDRFPFENFTVVNQDMAFQTRLPCFPLIRQARFDAMQLLWETCLERGYRRIGAILYRTPGGRADNDQLIGSFLLCQSRRPAHQRVPPHYYTEFADTRKAEFNTTIDAWVDEHRPDCLIAFNRAIDLARWELPHAFLIGARGESTGFSNVDREFELEQFTLLDQLIHSRTVGPQEHPFEVIVEPSWNEGSTLPTIAIA